MIIVPRGNDAREILRCSSCLQGHSSCSSLTGSQILLTLL